jgi:hypothetical protein
MLGKDIVLAKTALLNTYFRLNHAIEPIAGDITWFSFVRRILAIGRERVLAFVDPEMEVRVREIHDNIDQFRADYERTNAENHRGNVPPELRGRIASMISIKSTHDKGNFQLTLSKLTGPEEVLLDTDIDENGELHSLSSDWRGARHPCPFIALPREGRRAPQRLSTTVKKTGSAHTNRSPKNPVHFRD